MNTRNKAAVLASGRDPKMKQLRRLHAVKNAKQRELIAALEAIEDYWAEVRSALEKRR